MNTAFKNIVIKNGLFLGAALIAFELIKYATGILYTSNTGLSILLWLVSVAIYAYFIFVAVGQYKASNNDQLTVVDGLKVGAVVGVIAGVLLGIYNVLYTTVIDPDYYVKVMDLTIDAFSPMIDKMTESQAEEFYDKLVNSKPTTTATFIYSIIWGTIGGLIIGVIVGLVKKSKNN